MSASTRFSGGGAHDYDLGLPAQICAQRWFRFYINDVDHPVRRIRPRRTGCTPGVGTARGRGNVSNEGFKWLTAKRDDRGLCAKGAGAAGELRRLAGLGVAPIRSNTKRTSTTRSWKRERSTTSISWACGPWIPCGWKSPTGCGATDLNAENSILQAGLSPFVRMNKGEFHWP